MSTITKFPVTGEALGRLIAARRAAGQSISVEDVRPADKLAHLSIEGQADAQFCVAMFLANLALGEFLEANRVDVLLHLYDFSPDAWRILDGVITDNSLESVLNLIILSQAKLLVAKDPELTGGSTDAA